MKTEIDFGNGFCIDEQGTKRQFFRFSIDGTKKLFDITVLSSSNIVYAENCKQVGKFQKTPKSDLLQKWFNDNRQEIEKLFNLAETARLHPEKHPDFNSQWWTVKGLLV